LRQFGLNVSYCRVGGKSGRTMTIDCATCDYTVQELVTPCPGARHA
jgi:chemotaxis protein CheD